MQNAVPGSTQLRRAALAVSAFALLGVPAGAQPAAFEVPAGDYQLDPERSGLRITLGFAGVGAAHVRFTRLDGGLVHAPGAPERARVNINVDTTSATASAWTRRAALTALDPDRWPRASFVSERIRMDADGAWAMTGRLTLRGVTRPVTLNGAVAEATGAPAADVARLRFVGRGQIRRSEFGLPAPALTRDTMDLRFDVEFARRRAD